MLKVISREVARSRGRHTFFTGQPCRHGHVAERSVYTGMCKACVGARLGVLRKATQQREEQRMRMHTRSVYAACQKPLRRSAMTRRAEARGNALVLGMAGEHLVCAELLMAGYRAFVASQSCHYDVVVDTDVGLLRLQVKATYCPRYTNRLAARQPGYWWFVKRRGRDQKKIYRKGDFDLLALVALDTKQIAYMLQPPNINTVCIRVHDDGGPQQPNKWGGKPQGKRGRVFGDYTFETALAQLRELKGASR